MIATIQAETLADVCYDKRKAASKAYDRLQATRLDDAVGLSSLCDTITRRIQAQAVLEFWRSAESIADTTPETSVEVELTRFAATTVAMINRRERQDGILAAATAERDKVVLTAVEELLDAINPPTGVPY
jgi:hypothetical protein